MWTVTKAVCNKKPNFAKLTAYGFAAQGTDHVYGTDILAGTFVLTVCVSADGVTAIEVRDALTGEEYPLAYNENATGAFVGSVRDACTHRLQQIIDACYDPNIFKTAGAQQVIRYISQKYGADPEHLWQKTPNNAIFRKPGTPKWFAALLTVEKRKLGIPGEGVAEVLNLKAPPEQVAALVDGKTCFAAYHMNKKHWYTLYLDGAVPPAQVCRLIDISFDTLK